MNRASDGFIPPGKLLRNVMRQTIKEHIFKVFIEGGRRPVIIGATVKILTPRIRHFQELKIKTINERSLLIEHAIHK